MFTEGHELKDAGAVASSGYGQVGGSDRVVNLGSGLIRGNLILDISVINIYNNDEIYQIFLMGGDDTDFSREVSLACIEIGANEVAEGNLDAKAGRLILPFQNEFEGVVYPFVRVRHVIAGTTPSITYTARMEKSLPYRGRITQSATTTT